ncbi:unnamed protein product [Darwinula stevensoni]|uniref:Major facilitator superfamily (MFS) profile domain-containing protein n=1 Tax=Darwinula stevensoni TaxID=69355 RepID=A0A7R8XIG5_9CRUS|nr:unnamed protein product [Darwinula stevensoni]CAG0894306.1 unnamed protein product [Darwinula stevensoni]
MVLGWNEKCAALEWGTYRGSGCERVQRTLKRGEIEELHEPAVICELRCEMGGSPLRKLRFYKKFLTIASEFSWACGKSRYATDLLTIHSAGHIFGSFVFGPLSDYFGRKAGFFAAATVQWIFGLALILAPNFTGFAILTFIYAWSFPAVFQIGFILAVEQVGPDHRGRINVIVNLAWTLGMCVIAAFAWVVRGHWVHLALIANLPVLLYYLYIWLLEESPRWLASRNQMEKAESVLLRIAEKNEVEVPREKLERMLREVEEREQPVMPQYFALLRGPVMRARTFIMTFSYYVSLALYYGLHMDVGNLGGNPFLSTIVLAGIEFPSYYVTYLVMERFGRRWTSCGLLILSALGCALVPSTDSVNFERRLIFASFLDSVGTDANTAGAVLRIVWAVVAKFGVSGAYQVIYQQQVEIFPTVLRSTGMAFVSVVSAVLAIPIPYLLYLGEIHIAIPYATWAVLSLAAGIVASFLPETLKKDLPDTLEDSELFGKTQKFWSFNLAPPKSGMV